MRAEDLYRVSHKVVVVTGGANRHGFAIARAMSDNGARVVIFDVDRSGSERAVLELNSRGGKVRGETVDVTDAVGMRSAFDRILEQEGGLDVGVSGCPRKISGYGPNRLVGGLDPGAVGKDDKSSGHALLMYARM